MGASYSATGARPTTTTRSPSATTNNAAKPFVFEEVLARVRARLRGGDRGDAPALELQVAGVRLDIRTRRAEVAGREVELTAKEFTLLETFLRHPGQVLSREQRRKLGSARFETVRGMGYRMRDQP